MSLISFTASLFSKISAGSITDKNAYKKQPFYALHDESKLILEHKVILINKMKNAGCDASSIELFDIAFEYFIINYKQYDGATGDNQLHKIGDYWYDISSVVHDYLDVSNFTWNWDNLMVADRVLLKIMEQVGDSTYHIDKRALLLYTINPLRFLFSYKRRKSTRNVNLNQLTLINDYVDDFSINYKRILTLGLGLATFIYYIVFF